MIRHVKFVELPVLDQDRALAFYVDRMGLKVAKNVAYGDDGLRWIELRLPGAETTLLLTEASGEPPTKPMLVLKVDDVAASYQALRTKEVEFTQPPTIAPWEKSSSFALLHDSEGNIVMIVDA